MPLIYASEEKSAQRIYAYLKIHDPWEAVQEGKRRLIMYPDSPLVRLAYVEALGEKGDEKKAIEVWMAQKELFSFNQKALETLAWVTLQKARHSPQLSIQTAALIGSALTSHVKSIPIIVSALRSSNAILRFLAVKLAGQMGDDCLVQELVRLLKEETVWFVRKGVIESLGALKQAQVKPLLLDLIAKNRSDVGETFDLIGAFTALSGKIYLDHLNLLFHSESSGMRQLACRMAAHYDMLEAKMQIIHCLDDPISDVKEEAIYALALLKSLPSIDHLKKLMQDVHPKVAITAAWAACCRGHQEGVLVLEKWINSSYEECRWLAASALSRSGVLTHHKALSYLQAHEDPFVRANLAIGLIRQEVFTQEAGEQLNQFLQSMSDTKIMWKSFLADQIAVPSCVYHTGQASNYPYLVDQLTRLEMMKMLCLLEHHEVKLQVKNILSHDNLELSALATTILLEEEDVLLILEQLSQDENPKIRAHSALILAICLGEPKAISLLQNVYEQTDYEMKVKILEVLSQIGGKEVVPFLLDRLEEPFQLIRVIAASAIIQCLSH